MYVDTQLEFSDSQAVTATALSTNVVDLITTTTGGATLTSLSPNTSMDVGQGEVVYLVVVANAAFGGTGTITATLETSAAAAITGATVVASSAAVTATSITAGYPLLVTKLPNADYLRYIGVRYTCSGTPSGGTFDAFLTKDVQRAKIYKSAFTVQ